MPKSKQQQESDPSQINITLFTAFMHNRGGDLVNAAIFMKEMIKKKRNIKFTWVVKRDLEGRNADLLQHIKGIEQHVEIIDLKSSDYDKVIIRKNGDIKLNQNIDFPFNLHGTKLTLKKDSVLTDQQIEQMSDANFATWDPNSNGGWSELRKKIDEEPEFRNKMQATHMFCATPNLHRFVDKDRELFKQLNKPFVAISEYDFTSNTYKHVNDKMPTIDLEGWQKERKKYNAGFDPQHLGVYVDDTMLSTKGLEQIHSTDQTLKDYLLCNDLLKEYKGTHTLFYGYFFVKPDGSSPALDQSIVKIEEYVKNCIMSALNDSDKQNIDIVIPGLPDDKFEKIFESVLKDLDESKLKSVTVATKNSSNKFEEKEIYNNANSKGKTIRLINPKRVHRETIQCLLNDSELLCGLTGDQSWIEGLVKGKLTCYQTMIWKQHFFKAFLEYIKEKFTEEAKIYQFYKLQLNYNKAPKAAWQKMMLLYKNDKPTLDIQAKELAKFIKEEKNLIKHLDQIIKDAEQAKQLTTTKKARVQATQKDKASKERLKAETAKIPTLPRKQISNDDIANRVSKLDKLGKKFSLLQDFKFDTDQLNKYLSCLSKKVSSKDPSFIGNIKYTTSTAAPSATETTMANVFNHEKDPSFIGKVQHTTSTASPNATETTVANVFNHGNKIKLKFPPRSDGSLHEIQKDWVINFLKNLPLENGVEFTAIADGFKPKDLIQILQKINEINKTNDSKILLKFNCTNTGKDYDLVKQNIEIHNRNIEKIKLGSHELEKLIPYEENPIGSNQITTAKSNRL